MLGSVKAGKTQFWLNHTVKRFLKQERKWKEKHSLYSCSSVHSLSELQ